MRSLYTLRGGIHRTARVARLRCCHDVITAVMTSSRDQGRGFSGISASSSPPPPELLLPFFPCLPPRPVSPTVSCSAIPAVSCGSIIVMPDAQSIAPALVSNSIATCAHKNDSLCLSFPCAACPEPGLANEITESVSRKLRRVVSTFFSVSPRPSRSTLRCKTAQPLSPAAQPPQAPRAQCPSSSWGTTPPRDSLASSTRRPRSR